MFDQGHVQYVRDCHMFIYLFNEKVQAATKVDEQFKFQFHAFVNFLKHLRVIFKENLLLM